MEEFELEARKEYEEASSDLKKSQPKDVLRRFYPRLDSIIAKSIDESATPLACKKGCSYCCYYKVEAKPVEIFEIVRFAKSKFQPLEIHEILKQAKENVEEAKELSYEQHMATNQKFPFLIGSSCSVYEVRPAKCRNFHAPADDCELALFSSWYMPVKIDLAFIQRCIMHYRNILQTTFYCSVGRLCILSSICLVCP